MVRRARQSGRTPWRAASLRGERSNVPRDNAALYEAEEIGNKSAAFSETRVQQNRQQQYSVFGNKSVALNSGARSVSGGTFESDTDGTLENAPEGTFNALLAILLEVYAKE